MDRGSFGSLIKSSTQVQAGDSLRARLVDGWLALTVTDQPHLDLDDMVSKIERGYNLIKSMRTRLETTKQKVDQLRLDFE